MADFDITPTLKANSDQLNADDLVAGPITVQVTEVRQGNTETPVHVHISGGHMPFMPCKTMRRVLARAWGSRTGKWEGRWMRLYCDPTVRFGGREVGGVRIDALSHIKEPLSLSLAETRGKKAKHTISVLKPDDRRQQGNGTANLLALCRDEKISLDAVADWHDAKGWGELPPEGHPKRAEFAAHLVAHPNLIQEIREFAAQTGGDRFEHDGEE